MRAGVRGEATANNSPHRFMSQISTLQRAYGPAFEAFTHHSPRRDKLRLQKTATGTITRYRQGTVHHANTNIDMRKKYNGVILRTARSEEQWPITRIPKSWSTR